MLQKDLSATQIGDEVVQTDFMVTKEVDRASQDVDMASKEVDGASQKVVRDVQEVDWEAPEVGIETREVHRKPQAAVTKVPGQYTPWTWIQHRTRAADWRSSHCQISRPS